MTEYKALQHMHLHCKGPAVVEAWMPYYVQMNSPEKII